MPAAGVPRGRRAPRRGELMLGGRLLCYRVLQSAPTASCHSVRWSRSSSPRSVAVLGRGLIAPPFDAPGSEAHGEVVGGAVVAGTRAQWEAFNAEHDCCLEAAPGARRGVADEQTGARGMIVDGPAGGPVRLSEARKTSAAARRPGSARTRPRCWARPATTRARWPRCARPGRRSDARRRLLRRARRRALPSHRAHLRAVGPAPPARRAAVGAAHRLLERTAPRDDMVLARVTVEILARSRSPRSRSRLGRTARALRRAAGRGAPRGGEERCCARGPGGCSARRSGRRRAAGPAARSRTNRRRRSSAVVRYAHAVEWRWAAVGGAARAGDGLDARESRSSRAPSRRRASA